jgi:6-pyruvoyltetrahydropterin/6-carboxytetrahydropterin synthase
MFEVTVEEKFASGHALRNYHGKCENVHGHNYRVQVTLNGETLDQTGLLVDFVELKKVLGEIVERMDHRFLNDVPPFDVLNPSAENMARYIFDELSAGLPKDAPARVAWVRLWETDNCSATYRG